MRCASGVEHHFSSPLATILMFLYMLLSPCSYKTFFCTCCYALLPHCACYSPFRLP